MASRTVAHGEKGSTAGVIVQSISWSVIHPTRLSMVGNTSLARMPAAAGRALALRFLVRR